MVFLGLVKALTIEAAAEPEMGHYLVQRDFYELYNLAEVMLSV